MKSYYLRDIPAELLTALKVRAAKDGTTMKEIITRAIWAYLEEPKKCPFPHDELAPGQECPGCGR